MRSRQTDDTRAALAARIDRLKSELDALSAIFSSFDPSLPPSEVSADWIRGMLKARRRRDTIFGSGLFADAAWDILLELYAVHLQDGRATVSDLCKAAAVPYTTALRWLGRLELAKLIVRTPDDDDGRRIWVDLSPAGQGALEQYFRGPQSGGAGI